ncbi:MAG: DUF1624 domain-containing protein [Candidatus Lokiarchaeota archaeon]|nr:DUF1624 domain-containing protein [Candidatus Lokiarchaeota archaeon]
MKIGDSINDTSNAIKPIRLKSLDIFRGFGVILVIISHGSHYWCNDVYSIPFYIFNSLIPLGAPLFMLLIGISMIFMVDTMKINGKSDNEIRNLIIKRGLFLIGFGYFYNFIAEALIFLIAPYYIYPPNSALYIIYANSSFWDWLTLFGIFHILGLCLLVSYFLYKTPIKIRIVAAINVLIITIIITYLPLFFGGIPFHTFQPDWHYVPTAHPITIILDILFYGQYPIFPWIFYAIVGTIVGETLLEHMKKNEPQMFINKYWKKLTILLTSGLICLIFIFIPGFFPETTLYVLFITAALILLYMLVFRYIEINHKESKKLDYILGMLGRFSLSIYFLTGLLMVDLFLIIGVLIQIPLLGTMPFWLVVPLDVLFILLFILLTNAWAKNDFKYSLNWFERKITR